MRRTLLLLIFSIVCIFSFAQNKQASIHGIVYDTVSKKGLAYSTVSIVNVKDSTLISFTRADSSGKFILKNMSKGAYLLSASYVGFVSVWQDIFVKEGESLELGNINLTDLKNASAVTVTAKRAPVVMNNDTLEFNTENFKTQPNAVVEDLLKKLPGVTVDEDGTVRVNGQKINRVLVNGKEFFTGDPKLATKNLDADAVDKVQVFDKKSDRAEFTGVDDGQSEKAINLKLKKDRNKSLFGKVSAGVGNDGKYDAQTNINKFNGDQQISALGMANNTNRQGFSIGDVLNFTGELSKGMKSGGNITIKTGGGDDNALPISGMGQSQQGIANTFAGGVNFNDTWNKKTDFNGSIVASDVDLNTDRSTVRQNISPGNNFDYYANSTSRKDVKQQRANLSIDQKMDSTTSFKIVPQLTLQQNDTRTGNQYQSITASNTFLNSGNSLSTTHSDATNMVTTAQFRKKLAKKGRTISSNLNWNYNNSTQNGTLQTNTTYYTGGLPTKDSVINQINSRASNANSFGGNLIYTEPFGKKSLMEFSVFYNTSIGTSIRQSWDYNASNGKYDHLNDLQSNNFKNSFQFGGAGINWRSNQKKFNYTIGASVQRTGLVSTNQSNGNNIEQGFTDVLPLFNFQYKMNSTRMLNLNYTTSTQNPATTQLQPIIDVSDPLNSYLGNPNLKRTYQQSLNLNYFSANTFTQSNFFAFIALNKSDNAIVNSDILQSNGSRISMPVNADGVYSLFANADMGFPIKKLHSRIDFGIGTNYNNNISFLNGAKNTIQNSGIGPNASWSFAKDNKIDIRVSARLNFSKAEYGLQPQLNSNYLQQVYGFESTQNLPWGLIFNNTFNYTINTGRADGYNINMPIWNASMAKGFLKNSRAEIKFSVFDLLDKNQGVSRSANQNYIEDTRYNVLQRYFLLTATYRLNKAGSTASGARVVIRSINN
jgi:hypothetical protein